ncbi:ATP-binding protein [Alkalihalobacillus sp. BA299]|uniref:ATP-binding protein n=1 Tax=Alkalihalobacillus sp. BA299 TaxID=2815938 RepID=UPI001ADBD432|nr:ATP-binding protein [Alkalihalobacillus sp. BA299]
MNHEQSLSQYTLSLEEDIKRYKQENNKLQSYLEKSSDSIMRLDNQQMLLQLQIKRQERTFQFFQQLYQVTHSAKNTEQLFNLTLHSLIQNMGFDKAAIYQKDMNTFYPVAMKGYSSTEASSIQSIPVYYAQSIIEQNGIIVNKESRETYTEPYEHELGVKYFIACPLIIREKVEHIFLVGNNREETSLRSQLTIMDLETLRTLCQQLSIASANIQLYHHLERQIQVRTEALQESNFRLEEMNKELSRVEQSRRKLLSNISHDLGTPLSAIQVCVEAILDGLVEDSVEQERYLNIILSRVQGLKRLILDLFELSKLETREIRFEKTLLQLHPLTHHLFTKYEIEAKMADIRYEFVMGQSTNISIVADADRIEQVFANLITNAIKHTSPNGRIRVSTGLTNFLAKPYAMIKIEDNGCGISEEDLPYIFDRFYKGSKTRNSKDGGSGLGLAICKEIIEAHRGRIEAESSIGKGSTFSLMLPIESQCNE